MNSSKPLFNHTCNRTCEFKIINNFRFEIEQSDYIFIDNIYKYFKLKLNITFKEFYEYLVNLMIKNNDSFLVIDPNFFIFIHKKYIKDIAEKYNKINDLNDI